MSGFLGQVALAQTTTGCEKTPEGGTRCADGTYLPPGCQPGDPGTVQGAKPGTSVWPFIVGAGALAAGAAIALSGRRGMGLVPTLENSYPAVAADLRAVAGKITGERAADAWNFSQMQEASKQKYDLLYQQKAAEDNLRKQEKLWEQAHRNMDELQAATVEVERLGGEISAANAKIQEYRGYVETNAAAIMRYRAEAQGLIASLPREFQEEAKVIIDPCYKPKAMNGAYLGQLGYPSRVPGYGVQYGQNRPRKRPEDMIPGRRGILMGVEPSLGYPGRAPGAYGVQYGQNRPRKRPEDMIPGRRGILMGNGAPWAPYMGQTTAAPSVAPTTAKRPPADFKESAIEYGFGAGFGILVGSAMNLIMPSTRNTRKEGWSMAAFASGVSLAGYLLNLGFGEKGFFSSMVRVGGLFTGNAIADVLFPSPNRVCMTVPEVPKLAGWRR